MAAARVSFRLCLDGAWVRAEELLPELDAFVARQVGGAGRDPAALLGGFFVEVDGEPWRGADRIGPLRGADRWFPPLEELLRGAADARLVSCRPGESTLLLRRADSRLELEEFDGRGELVCPAVGFEAEQFLDEFIREARALEALVDALRDKLEALTRGRAAVLPGAVRERIEALDREGLPPPDLGRRLDILEGLRYGEDLEGALEAIEEVARRRGTMPGGEAEPSLPAEPAEPSEPRTEPVMTPPEPSNPEVAQALEAFRVGTPDARFEALVALERMGEAACEAVPALRQAFADGDAGIRLGVAAVLGSIGTDEAAAALRSGLEDPNPDVRIQAADSIQRIRPGDDSIVPTLLCLLDSDDPATRSESIRVLGDLGPAAASATPRLCQALTDAAEWWLNRVRAAEALGWIGRGDDEVRDALTAAHGARDVNVRRAATTAMNALGLEIPVSDPG